MGSLLQETEDNFPESYFYDLSLDYCANSHEFAHYVVDDTIIPGWANEGLVSYTQKNLQRTAMNSFTCGEEGHTGQDTWTWGEDDLYFPYSDLSEEPTSTAESRKHSRTHLCFWELFDAEFGADKRHEVFQLLRDEYTAVVDTYQTYRLKDGTIISVPSESTFFIENVLFEVVDYAGLKIFLERFGFEEGVDYTLD